MEILQNIIFLIVGLIVGVILTYTWAYFRYENKDKIDKIYKENKELKEIKENLEHKVKELSKQVKELSQALEKAKREIMEKNKYLSEDKVIIERLYEIKKLSDKISDILTDYDKETIQKLLEEYKKGELCEIEKEIAEKEKKW